MPVQSPINLSMHIRSYLNEFNQLKSSPIKQIETILMSPNKARKPVKKLHQLDEQQFTDNFKSLKKTNDKNNELTFDDELFTALYKTSQRLHHQRYNALAKKGNQAKLQFKLNYVENQRPIVKQKILFKANKQEVSTTENLNTEEKINLIGKTKKRKSQKYMTSSNDRSFIQEIKKNSQHKNNLIKQKIVKFGQDRNQTKSSSQIKKCNTLPSHRIKYSLSNNDSGYFREKPSNLMHLTPQNKKEKPAMWNQLPEYAKNIMKPCKIQGIQLVNRPQKIVKGRRSQGECMKKRADVVKSEQKRQQKQFYNVRLIKTARQKRKKPKRANSIPVRNPQRVIQVQPWNHRWQNFEEEDQLLFSTEEINSFQWSGVTTCQ